MTIPIARPLLGEEEIAAVAAVLRSGVIARGPRVDEFEARFREVSGTAHAVATSSGTAALHAALHAAGIRRGDEVIVPSFTFMGTASAVCMCGARPVFADVDGVTCTLDSADVARKLSPQTRAVIGVHLFGHPCDTRALGEICDDAGLVFIEDAAQAHGALDRGRPVGSIGDLGCFSFYPTKNMTTGEGGMVTTDDATLACRVRRFIDHGQEEKYLHAEVGHNYRMTDIAAAMGLVQLGRLPEANEARIENARRYREGLFATPLILPREAPGVRHVYHQFVVQVSPKAPFTRKELIDHLAGRGIGTAIHYPIPLHRQPAFAGIGGECPVSDRLATQVLSLPVHPGVSTGDVDEVCRTIREVC